MINLNLIFNNNLYFIANKIENINSYFITSGSYKKNLEIFAKEVFIIDVKTFPNLLFTTSPYMITLKNIFKKNHKFFLC